MKTKLKTKAAKLLAFFGLVCMSFMAATGVSRAQCCITLLAPTNTATITISSPFGLTADFNAADNPAVFSDQVIVGNPAVAPGTYLGWCVDVVDDIGNGPSTYNTTMYSSCDPNLNNELPAGYPASVYASPANWHAVNYILNHKNGAYFWNIQYAIWYFVGGPAPSGLGPPAYPQSDQNEINALVNDALQNAPTWQSQCGDVLAVLVSVNSDTLPHSQLTIIEVPCCSVNFVKCPVSVDLGCNPANIPDCTGTVDTNIVYAVSCCGRPVTITCSKSESTVNCKTYRTLTYTASDDMGHTATCQQTITWSADTTAPTLLNVPTGTNFGCNPPAASLPTDASIKAQVGVTDGCSAATLSVTHVDSGTSCGYIRTFTISAIDGCSNRVATNVVYTWKADTNAPTFISVPTGTNLGCNPALPTDDSVKGKVSASDDCGSATINVSHVDGGTPCASTRKFTITATDGCGNVSTTNVTYTYKVDVSGPIITCPPDFYTNSVTTVTCYNQDGWNGSCNNNPCTMIGNCFSKIYSNGYLECGLSGYNGHSIKCSSFSYVKNLLPCSGTPSCLNYDYSNPTSCGGGAFAGHLMCLQLNVDCGDNSGLTGFKGCFGNLVLNDPTCPLNGKCVRDIAKICHTALGGGSTSGCSLSQLCNLCSNLNNCFSNSIPNDWCKSHITNIVTTNIPPSVSGYATATDSCGGAVTVTNSDVITSGGCGGTYVITRTWTAKDTCGNVSTCVQHIYIGNPSASVCGYVFKDCNGDGRLSAGIDVGISNILVTLKNGSGVIVASNTTDNTGAYCFYNLTPGTYTVCIAQPSGHTQTAGCHTNHWLDDNSNDCWNENDGYQHWKGSDGVDCWFANDGCQHYKNSYGQDCWKDKYGYTHSQNCNYTSCNVPKSGCETFTLSGCEAKTSVNFAYQGSTGTCQVSVSGPSKGVCGKTYGYTCTVSNNGTACLSSCNVNVCGSNYSCPSLKPGESCTFQFNYCYKLNDYGNYNCKATATCNYNGGSNCYGSSSCNTSVGFW